jgi:hypothetical protein
MPAAFSYRPKFVDIRVKRPDPGVKAREAGERACDHKGCERAGAHKAPKGRDRENEFWWFCAEHAGDYNRRWNFFRDMSDAEYEAFKMAEEIGHRPTWSFRPGRGDRVGAGRFWQAARKGDSFGLFGGFARTRAEPRKPRIGRLQVLALHVLALEEGAEPDAIRARYAELVKRYHPDSNQGDRTAEAQLNKVLKAYQTLKQAGMA